MKSKKKVLLFAILGLLGFFLLTEILNYVSVNNSDNMYTTHCGGCHGAEGEGLKYLIPPLANADWLANNNEELACVIKYGMKDSLQVNGTWYNQEMLGLDHLTDIQIANIVNYVNQSWGNEFGYTSVDSVNTLLTKCK